MPEVKMLIDGQELMVKCEPRVNVLVPESGMSVKIPGYLEINSRDSLKYMEEMSQAKWEFISTGPLFQHFFRIMFPPEDGEVRIPANIKDLVDGDFGVAQISGLIIRLCESIFDGNGKVFIRTPEDGLHPKAVRHLMSMINAVYDILAPDSKTGTILDEIGKPSSVVQLDRDKMEESGENDEQAEGIQ